DIKRAGSQPSTKGSGDYFSGTVRIDPLFQAPAPARVSGAAVTFEPGARKAWHTHPLGQTLVVTAGFGRVQRWGDPIEEIQPGDVRRPRRSHARRVGREGVSPRHRREGGDALQETRIHDVNPATRPGKEGIESCEEQFSTVRATSALTSVRTPASSSRRMPSSGCRQRASAARICGPIAVSTRRATPPPWVTNIAAASKRSAAA